MHFQLCKIYLRGDIKTDIAVYCYGRAKFQVQYMLGTLWQPVISLDLYLLVKVNKGYTLLGCKGQCIRVSWSIYEQI